DRRAERRTSSPHGARACHHAVRPTVAGVDDPWRGPCTASIETVAAHSAAAFRSFADLGLWLLSGSSRVPLALGSSRSSGGASFGPRLRRASQRLRIARPRAVSWRKETGGLPPKSTNWR